MKTLVDRVPSNFYLYPKGLRIQYEPFTIGDLKRFFKVNGVVDIMDLYAGKIFMEGVENFSVWDLYYGDFQFLVVQIYMASIEETGMDLRVNCNCGNSFVQNFSLVDLTFKTLDFGEEIQFQGYVLRPPRLRDMRELLGSNEDIGEKWYGLYVESDKPLESRIDDNVVIGHFLKVVKKLDIGAMPFEALCEKCQSKIGVDVRLDFFTLI